MSTSPINGDGSPEGKDIPPKASTVILLLGTIGDTTWRMFIPIIGLTILGVITDRSYGTKPWATAIGIVVGTLIAGWLIKQQLQKASKK